MFWFFSVGGKIVIDVRLGYIIIDGSIARVPVIAVIIPISALPHYLTPDQGCQPVTMMS